MAVDYRFKQKKGNNCLKTIQTLVEFKQFLCFSKFTLAKCVVSRSSFFNLYTVTPCIFSNDNEPNICQRIRQVRLIAKAK